MSVANPGPAEYAGSKRNRLRINGIQLPRITETITIMASAKLTAREPRICPPPCVKKIRANEKAPRTKAIIPAIRNSRRMNLNIFDGLISPEAIP